MSCRLAIVWSFRSSHGCSCRGTPTRGAVSHFSRFGAHLSLVIYMWFSVISRGDINNRTRTSHTFSPQLPSPNKVRPGPTQLLVLFYHISVFRPAHNSQVQQGVRARRPGAGGCGVRRLNLVEIKYNSNSDSLPNYKTKLLYIQPTTHSRTTPPHLTSSGVCI